MTTREVTDRPALQPLTTWSVVNRGRFEVARDGHTWTVDVDFLDLREQVRLYRDGTLVEQRRSPAVFHLGDAAIEAKMGLLGMDRIDLIAAGERTVLTPVDGTAEAWRLGLARDRPQLSRALGALSWTVLVIALVVDARQLLGLAGVDFDPTLALPQLANIALGIAALAAVVERALRFKSSRWLG